MMLYPF